MMSELPEFILLTGALGSGKTTLLSDYIASERASDTGVIINDAGEVNVDGAVINADSRNLTMATLSNGCICCSMGNSVQEGIDALLAARAEQQLGPLRRIILETSGLAEPGPILRSLSQVRQMNFKLRIVATFNASRTYDGDQFLPQYAAQLAAAQVIVITKLDAPEPPDQPSAEATVKTFNPLASMITYGDRPARARAAFESNIATQPSAVPMFMASDATSVRIRTALARWTRDASWEDIGEWIENVSAFFGERLLRMKGLVRPVGFAHPILVNGVGGVFSPPRAIRNNDDEALGLIMILRDAEPSEFSDVAVCNPALEMRFK